MIDNCLKQLQLSILSKLLREHKIKFYGYFICRLERDQGDESIYPPDNLTFDVRVDTDSRQVQST